jgi:hypothetical protein
MSLNWDMQKVADLESLHDEATNPWGWPISKAIIFGTMSIGVGEISEKTLPEVVARFEFYQDVVGALLLNEHGQPRRVTAADLKRRVGLRTNVSKEPEGKWVKRLADSKFRDAKLLARRALDDLAAEAVARAMAEEPDAG